MKRVFLIVLDSMGIGELPDAADFGDTGSNTLAAIMQSKKFSTPNLQKLGLFNIDSVGGTPCANPTASYARMTEESLGKDTTIGHWEIAGIISPKALPTYPNGFPEELLAEYSRLTGRKILCNLPYSGTELLEDYGKEHMETGALIVYTSADSVFQIAAHEGIVPIEELYEDCQIARDLLTGEHGVGRVIARPFIGEPGSFARTHNRRDFSLQPPKKTMLDCLQEKGYETIGVGKIYDIFAGKSVSEKIKTQDNEDGMNQSIKLLNREFEGLCFINLVDFDMSFGHRNDVDGYANAMTEFDVQLGAFMEGLKPDDVVMITADHGCDPATPSTDHSREYTPLLVFGESIKQGVNLGTRASFADISATILELFGFEVQTDGKSFYTAVKK